MVSVFYRQVVNFGLKDTVVDEINEQNKTFKYLGWCDIAIPTKLSRAALNLRHWQASLNLLLVTWFFLSYIKMFFLFVILYEYLVLSIFVYCSYLSSGRCASIDVIFTTHLGAWTPDGLIDIVNWLLLNRLISFFQGLSSDLRRSKTPPRRSPEERAVPRPPSAPVHHERPSHTPHTPHLSPKKEAFNNLLNKSISGE